ncbi:MAG: isoprenylcysteine carboxylmethyltransferase family protein [Anaerolineales bacterium]|nr:isoprenylcysteine carboxylmethyltransferase family protein [Anaerolineales bacterium]
MNTDVSIEQPNKKSDISGGVLKWLLKVCFSILVLAAVLFTSSGRLDWMMAWVYIVVYVVYLGVTALILISNNPELVAERAQIKQDVKDWDKVLARLTAIFGTGVTLLVAGLDMRFGWSSQITLVFQIGGLTVAVLGYLLTFWAMVSNKFFSAFVRIQKDRGHTVATAGPYQVLRHPGYVGMTMFALGTPLVLGSLWALIPAGLSMCLTVVRTKLEDRTLQDELEGYKDYARRVRYRLLPGIW